MDKEEKCTNFPCDCGINTIEMKGSLEKLKEKTVEINLIKIKTDFDLLKFNDLKADIRKGIENLAETIENTEKNCNLDLKDEKSVTTAMQKWVEKENWYALKRLIDNATELFDENLHHQCYEMKKEE